MERNIYKIGKELFITNDEEIKYVNSWVIGIDGSPYKIEDLDCVLDSDKKIILTDNPDLIKDGVQVIDDEFLEWFVKNPSCEFVEVEESTLLNTSRTFLGVEKYKIIITSEQPKQEPLEEAAEKYLKDVNTKVHKDLERDGWLKIGFINGYKLAQQQNKNLYSDKNIINALHSAELKYNRDFSKIYQCMKEWLEQFKRK